MIPKKRYVYVVMCGCIGDYSIHDIYSSKEKAENEILRMNADTWEKSTEPWLEKWEVK